MEIHPNAFATELIRIIAAKTGHRYWIIKKKIFFLRNGFPSSVTSSSIFFTPMTLETRRQVAIAAMGIITELVEIKEIQKLHADDGYVCQWSVS